MRGNSAHEPLLSSGRTDERLDRTRVYPHCFPYGEGPLRIVGSPSGHPIVVVPALIRCALSARFLLKVLIPGAIPGVCTTRFTVGYSSRGGLIPEQFPRWDIPVPQLLGHLSDTNLTVVAHPWAIQGVTVPFCTDIPVIPAVSPVLHPCSPPPESSLSAQNCSKR